MIRIAAPDLGERERAYVAEAMASGWLSSRGPFVERFETAFAAFCGTTHGVACNSGTSALHLALAALKVGPGDEVIVPACTMIGTVNPVRLVGASPVVVDVDPGLWTLDPRRVGAALTPRTRAIIVTHLYGQPADVDAIRTAAPAIPIVEDAAEAHGATLRGRKAGALGDIAAFSFYANKILTCGEGGMVTTNRADLAERCASLRDHFFGGDESRYEHPEVGFSYRLSNLQAAAGLAQVERAAELVEKSRQVGVRYRAALGSDTRFELQSLTTASVNVCWVFPLVMAGSHAMSRDAMRTELQKRGVETRAVFHPIHRQPMYRNAAPSPCPVAERLGERGFYLPSGPGRTKDDVDAVVDAIRAIK